VVLSGGVWQNLVLLRLSMALLTDAGFQVLVHRRVPANDGGLALGQAMIASVRSRNEQPAWGGTVMCLGIPGRIQEIRETELLRMGTVDVGGVSREVCLSYVPDADVGDYVIVHVGFAISQLDEKEAMATLDILRQMGAIEEELGITGSAAPEKETAP
jgi:hydrogenase expression/formation protein HypC